MASSPSGNRPTASLSDYHAQYCEWVKEHPEAVAKAADTIRMFTLMMPSQNSELTAEALHTGLNIVGEYNAHLLRPVNVTPNKLRLYLRTLQHVQLLVEMAAEKFVGRKKKMEAIFMVEFAKGLCRLLLLLRGQDREHRGALSNLPRAESCKVDLNSGKERRWRLATILDIVRPLIYLGLMILLHPSYSKNKTASWRKVRAWTPWLLSVALAVIARQVTEASAACGDKFDAAEMEEIQRRGGVLSTHALRAPFYGAVVGPVVNKVKSIGQRVPLLGGMVVLGMDLVQALQSYYFYASGT